MNLKSRIKYKIASLIPNSLKSVILEQSIIESDQYLCYSYAQEGEDLILGRIFQNKNDGFYIDIGAHHPFRFSNTYSFYKRGWRGINIEANPDIIDKFNIERPNDINLGIAVSVKREALVYYNFLEKALNTFSKNNADEYQSLGYQLETAIPVQTFGLDEILKKHLPPNQTVDFMSIDVEGLEMDVLTSNDWEYCKPKVILAEILGSSIHELESTTVSEFLKSKGYKIFAKSVHTVFFKLS